jgi:hypothetical protein
VEQVDFADRVSYAFCIQREEPVGVAILTRVLFILLTLRLLVPPGMCLCKLSSPASRLLASVLGNDLPPPEGETDDHHHHDGCPASPLSTAMGLRPDGPGPIEMPLIGMLTALHEAVSAATVSLLDLLLCDTPCPPLCVSCCALRC